VRERGLVVMPKIDPRTDAYIAKSADFAQPILRHLRQLVHQACPEAEETIKWNFPVFMHKGMLCSMAAFKEHCTFGFWKAPLIFAKHGERAKEAMGHFGRITSLADLPSDKMLRGYIQKAAQLNETGLKLPRKTRPKVDRALEVPVDLEAALQVNKKARSTFESFSYSHKKEYVEWIAEAKREDTRQKRLETTLQWLAQGKSRNWKYANC
jgi:uncharacterized protein YdeI (YjbR/CyaY-like superfamily)